MENPIVGQLQNGIRRIETELGGIKQARAKKRREVRKRRRPCDILSSKKCKERKPRNAAPGN